MYPKLRFKGFADEWEEYKLGKIGKTTSGIGFPEIEQGGLEGTPFYKISDMNNKENKTEMVKANNYVSEDQIKRRKWKPIEKVPAIIFAKVGAAIMLNRKRLVTNTFLIDNNTMAYSFNKVWNTQFGKALFETINLIKYAQIGALPSYNNSDVENIQVNIPKIKEQQKIGQFFKKLDELIDLNQNKLDKLKELKKGYLQKIFPGKGETIPKVRFKGFDDDWEFRKLEDIVIVNSGKDYKHLKSGNVPVYGTGGYMLSVNDSLSDKTDAIGIGRKGTINKPFILNAPFWTVDTLFYTFAQKNTDLYFLLMTFFNIKWSKFDESTGVPSLSKSTINNISVIIPLYTEQQKIGQFFKKVDELIDNQSKKIDQLKELKKGYLQKMFV